MLRPAGDDRSNANFGLLCGLAAYLSWGVVPIYFKLIAHLPALYVLAHRIIWSLVFLAILTTALRAWAEIRSVMSSRRLLVPLLVSTLLISVNWYTFIYAIESKRLLQASMGYFINPLVSVLLGVAVMNERLRRWQIVGLVLAAAGVAVLTWSRGHVPWIALILAISFGLYGLMRKVMHVGAIGGLTIETGLLFVPSVLVAVLMTLKHPAALQHQWPGMYGVLMLSGVITSVPLLLFAAAARRLRLSTMGFLQYIAPSSQFLLAVFAFGEPFDRWLLISFGLIWSALIIYTTESYLEYRRRGSLAIGSAAPQAVDDGAEPTA